MYPGAAARPRVDGARSTRSIDQSVMGAAAAASATPFAAM
jgi:hypothetical protein